MTEAHLQRRRRARIVLFAMAASCTLPGVVHVALAMPAFGDHPLPYGDVINAAGVAERHITNMISAVNFDYRGFDTLGEESMLLCAVTGVTALLRGARGERVMARPGVLPGRPIPRRSEAVTIATRFAGPILLAFGLYVALHATGTPGGGFQGGAIIASGLLLIFLGEGYRGWRRMVKSAAWDALEGLGAALYGACGFASMALGLPFLTNFLPLGTPGDVFSGGLMLVENAGVTMAVAGGFTVLFVEFLEETRALGAADHEPHD